MVCLFYKYNLHYTTVAEAKEKYAKLSFSLEALNKEKAELENQDFDSLSQSEKDRLCKCVTIYISSNSKGLEIVDKRSKKTPYMRLTKKSDTIYGVFLLT